jgi:hypothetical protein
VLDSGSKQVKEEEKGKREMRRQNKEEGIRDKGGKT